VNQSRVWPRLHWAVLDERGSQGLVHWSAPSWASPASARKGAWWASAGGPGHAGSVTVLLRFRNQPSATRWPRGRLQ